MAPLHASQTGLGIEPQTLIVNSWPVYHLTDCYPKKIILLIKKMSKMV